MKLTRVKKEYRPWPEIRFALEYAKDRVLHLSEKELEELEELISKRITAKKLWEELGDVAVNVDDEIDEEFLVEELGITFDRGTDKEYIWHWFEETFNISIAQDLMNLE